jgi:ATP-binding cassette subfamily B protein
MEELQSIEPNKPGEKPAGDNISWPRLLHWAWHIVKGSLALFVMATIVQLVSPLALQYNAQLLARIVAEVKQTPATTPTTPPTTQAPPATQPPATAPPATPPASKGKADDGILGFLFPSSLETAAIVLVISAVVLILAVLGDRIFQSWIDTVIASRLQLELHDRMIQLGPDYHRKHDLAETNLIVNGFSQGTQQLLCDVIAFPLVRGISLITAVLLLIDNFSQISGQPAWVKIALLSGILILPLGGWWIAKHVVRTARAAVETRTAVNKEFMNSCANPQEINLMGAAGQRSRAFKSSLDDAMRASIKALIPRELSVQFQTAVPRILGAVFVLFGVFVALRAGDANVAGAIVGFALIVPLAVEPINQLIQFYTGLSGAWPQIDKVVSVLEAKVDDESARTKPLEAKEAAIAFKEVDFAYALGGAKVLNGFSHVFPAGKVTAIVARSGGGKSTILNLISRQRRPMSGTILIGDTPLEEAATESLRRNVFKVAQFPVFMVDTVRANFRLAKEDATDQEIEEACRHSGLWPILVAAAPRGASPLETVLPRKLEDMLSGGQQKLFAVTRGLLRRPRVLLLDEPTTGVDTIGIDALAKVLKPVVAGLTVVLVDHRMSLVEAMSDQIVCLAGGKVAAVGSPKELDRPGTLFYELKQLERALGPEEGKAGKVAAVVSAEPDEMAPLEMEMELKPIR